jgi:hypothetical protein
MSLKSSNSRMPLALTPGTSHRSTRKFFHIVSRTQPVGCSLSKARQQHNPTLIREAHELRKVEPSIVGEAVRAQGRNLMPRVDS